MTRLKFFLLMLSLLLLLGGAGAAFQQGAIRVAEVDGSPDTKLARYLKFPNGSLSSSGDTVTVGAGGAWLVTGAEGADAFLTLQADESDDNGDDWKFEADTTTNDLIISNDTSGSQVAKLTIADTTGDLTLTGDIINENADSLLMNTDDVLVFSSDDEVATIRALGFEAKNAALHLFADQDDDATDGWFFTATTSGTLTIGNDSSAAGTAVTKFTMAGSDGDITLTGGIVGDGGDTFVGFLRSQVVSTTTTLTAAQCGCTVYNDSADVLTLPEASTVPGCRYTFIVANASNLDINPNDATDLILPFVNAIATDPTLISPSAGDAIRCATVGGSITIEAVGADSWAVVGGVAGHSWSDIN